MESQSKSLLSIVSDISDFNRTMVESGGELTAELEERLALNGVDLAKKVDAYVHIMENCDVQSVYFKGRADMMTAGRRTFEAIKENLKERVKFAMREMDTTDLHGVDYRFKGSILKPKLVIDESLVPPEYFTEEPPPPPVKILDRDKIEAALSLGIEIPGVTQEEVMSLRSYANASSQTKKLKGKKDE